MEEIYRKLYAGLVIVLLGYSSYWWVKWIMADSISLRGGVIVDRKEKPFQFWVFKIFIGFFALLLITGFVSYLFEYVRSAFGVGL